MRRVMEGWYGDSRLLLYVSIIQSATFSDMKTA